MAINRFSGGADNRDVQLEARARGESGAALVEFALVLPVFLMLVLGVFTGGLAYSRKIAVAEATREGARFAATRPVAGSVDAWLDKVAAVTQSSADGELAADVPGQSICVAYVPAEPAPARSRVQTGTAVSYVSAPCATDGRAGETRVQVVAARSSTLEALLWSRDLSLSSTSVARFEAG